MIKREIKRDEMDELLHEARKEGYAAVPESVMEELFSTWQRVSEAPVGTVSSVEWEDSDRIIPHIDKDEGDVLMWESIRNGQRVRLVPEADSGGDTP